MPEPRNQRLLVLLVCLIGLMGIGVVVLLLELDA